MLQWGASKQNITQVINLFKDPKWKLCCHLITLMLFHPNPWAFLFIFETQANTVFIISSSLSICWNPHNQNFHAFKSKDLYESSNPCLLKGHNHPMFTSTLSISDQIDGSIGLKNLHVNTSINPTEFDLNEI